MQYAPFVSKVRLNVLSRSMRRSMFRSMCWIDQCVDGSIGTPHQSIDVPNPSIYVPYRLVMQIIDQRDRIDVLTRYAESTDRCSKSIVQCFQLIQHSNDHFWLLKQMAHNMLTLFSVCSFPVTSMIQVQPTERCKCHTICSPMIQVQRPVKSQTAYAAITLLAGVY